MWGGGNAGAYLHRPCATQALPSRWRVRVQPTAYARAIWRRPCTGQTPSAFDISPPHPECFSPAPHPMSLNAEPYSKPPTPYPLLPTPSTLNPKRTFYSSVPRLGIQGVGCGGCRCISSSPVRRAKYLARKKTPHTEPYFAHKKTHPIQKRTPIGTSPKRKRTPYRTLWCVVRNAPAHILIACTPRKFCFHAQPLHLRFVRHLGLHSFLMLGYCVDPLCLCQCWGYCVDALCLCLRFFMPMFLNIYAYVYV